MGGRVVVVTALCVVAVCTYTYIALHNIHNNHLTSVLHEFHYDEALKNGELKFKNYCTTKIMVLSIYSYERFHNKIKNDMIYERTDGVIMSFISYIHNNHITYNVVQSEKKLDKITTVDYLNGT